MGRNRGNADVKGVAAGVWQGWRGSRLTDLALRATGVLGLAAIPLAIAWPAGGAAIGFALTTAWLNGPLAPIFPAAYEALLIPLGKLVAPWMLATGGMLVIVAVELLNLRLYKQVIGPDAIGWIEQHPLPRLVLRWFRGAPMLTVWLCAWSPLPFWSARIMTALAGYSVARYIVAMVLGRWPRLWVFAALGEAWSVNVYVLWLTVFLVGAAPVLWRISHRRTIRQTCAKDLALQEEYSFLKQPE